jgi:hypothetical protein
MSAQRPFLIRIVPPDFDLAILHSNRDLWGTVQRLRLAFNESYTKLSVCRRTAVSSRAQNIDLLRQCVASGVAARRAGTTYFEELPEEARVQTFFAAPSCPLAKLPPHTGTPESVAEWARQGQAVLAQYIGEAPPDAEAVFAVLLIRFAFERWAPARAEGGEADALTAQRERIRTLTPREAHLVERYVPPECADLPVTRLFEVSSIARAPLDWLQIVPFFACPLDVAYTIFKTHEALTKMATLQATQAQENPQAQAFFERMPGFDDIFGHWIALLAASDLPDPKSIVAFVNEWAGLPGFPQRFLACCAYLEAAVRQIETFGQDHEEEEEA